MESEREAIILGALLHDIGKFAQRAEIPLKSQSKSLETTLCPSYKGRNTHLHVLWTNDFFEENKNFFPINTSLKFSDNPRDTFLNLAPSHHNPETVIQKIIEQADKLSAGMDRYDMDLEDEISGKYKYKKERAHSIFEKINLFNENKREIKYRYELKPIIPVKNTMPKEISSFEKLNNVSLVDEYKILWENFIKEFKSIKFNTFEDFLNVLLWLLEKYTWCIPSSVVDAPDVSLYDHLRTTAAIAICLYDYHKENDSLKLELISSNDEKKFILLAGDLSGIQKYIFNLSHTNVEGVSKRLRARSFYLSALTDVSTHLILHSLNLPLICNLINAGGRFIILLPNTKSVKEKLKEISKNISNWFLENFAGELNLNLDFSIELNGKDFSLDNFSFIIKKLADNIEEKKKKKLENILSDDFSWNSKKFIIEKLEYKGKNACRNCEKYPIYKDDFCLQCYEQEKIGKLITHCKVFAYSKSKAVSENFISFFSNQYFISFFEEGDKIFKDAYLVERIYDPEVIQSTQKIKFLANYIPIFEEKDKEICNFCKITKDCEIKNNIIGKHKTFQCIASNAIFKNGKGSDFLGILRSDIDNMGIIFSSGLSDLSISRFATLSRMLNLFFNGYLEEKIQEGFKNTYTVYSGGDDLFLISDWQTIIDISEKVNNDFRNFTCKNDSITISSGIFIMKPNFPVGRGADLSEELIKESKNTGGNRLSLFGTIIIWQELKKLIDFGKYLDEKLNDEENPLTLSFLYRLFKYHNMYLKTKEKNYNFRNLLYIPLMTYDISRNIKRDGNEKSIELIKNLQKIYLNEENLMENLKIPLFYAIYKNRGEKGG